MPPTPSNFENRARTPADDEGIRKLDRLLEQFDVANRRVAEIDKLRHANANQRALLACELADDWGYSQAQIVALIPDVSDRSVARDLIQRGRALRAATPTAKEPHAN